MFWQDPITNSGCLTWNTESHFFLCWLSILSFIHRVAGRTGDVVSVVLVRQSDGLLDFSRKGSICVFLYLVVSVLLEIPGEFRRGVWTGSESWAGYSDRLLLLQLTWDFNCGARRRICGLKSNTDFTLKNTVNVTDVGQKVFFKANTDYIVLQLLVNYSLDQLMSVSVILQLNWNKNFMFHPNFNPFVKTTSWDMNLSKVVEYCEHLLRQ